MINNTQKRYTDRELVVMLQILASDLGKRPTQRDILKDDRLPTHHTYIKRFGSMKEALEIADVLTLEDRAYTHKLGYEYLVSEIGEENVQTDVEDLTVVHFRVKVDGSWVNIDYIDLVWSDGEHIETLEEIKRLREVMFNAGNLEGDYYQVSNLIDLTELVGVLRAANRQ